jgi:serine/threonine protein kinase
VLELRDRELGRQPVLYELRDEARLVSSDPRIGTQIGDYRIERLLGRGGMSVVYLSEHVRLKRKAALKVLSPELAEDPTFRARFVSEWERLAQLDHPNIIPVFEAGEADGLLYIAMRYVRTTDLKGLIEQEGHLDPERAVRIIAQTASALDAAHEQDLVHRDVKPANILVAIGAGPEGTDHVYLSDFGLTKHTQSRSGLTQTGHFMGTIDYVAPEQISGKGVDGRTDQYALACVLYQCLTGEVPFPREEDTAALFAHLQDAPPRATEHRPELPSGIDDVIARALSKAKEDRFDSCADFARAARAALSVAASTTMAAAPISGTVLASPPVTGDVTEPADGADLPSAPSIQSPPPPVVEPLPVAAGGPGPAHAEARRPSSQKWIAAGVVLLVLGAGVLVFTLTGGDDGGGGGGGTGGTGETGSQSQGVLLFDDFGDPSTGWEETSANGVTQGYVDGRYQVSFDLAAQPGVFAIAKGGADAISSGNVGVSARITLLSESESRRDGFGLACRVGSGGAYYFIVSSTGGWSIQELEAGHRNPKVLLDSQGQQPVPIQDVNRMEITCTGSANGPARLTLTVNGTEVPVVTDDTPLPPGSVGMAVAGPTIDPPAGLSVAFDGFRVEDLSALDVPSG